MQTWLLYSVGLSAFLSNEIFKENPFEHGSPWKVIAIGTCFLAAMIDDAIESLLKDMNINQRLSHPIGADCLENESKKMKWNFQNSENREINTLPKCLTLHIHTNNWLSLYYFINKRANYLLINTFFFKKKIKLLEVTEKGVTLLNKLFRILYFFQY